MPILEYACRACGHTFEFLRLPTTSVPDSHPTAQSPRGGDPASHPTAQSPRGGDPTCPECHSGDLERLPSGFAVNTAEMSRARVKAARKQFRQSKDYKDKQVAEEEHVREHMEDHLPPRK